MRQESRIGRAGRVACMKFFVFSGGLALSVITLSIARGSVPLRNQRVTDDTLIYDRVTEIRAQRAAKPDFDAELQSLSAMESRYREHLPALERLQAPMKRVAQQHYRYGAGAKQQGQTTVRQ